MLEETDIKEDISEEIEYYISCDADDKVVEKVDSPIVGHAHTIHPHHLNELLLLLKHNKVKKDRQ